MHGPAKPRSPEPPLYDQRRGLLRLDDSFMRLIAPALAATSGIVLITFAVAYYLTYEPAPEIRILWRAGLEPERRAELEHRFLLVNSLPFEDRLTYDLLDTSRENVEALVHERDIQDSDRVDRVGFTIPPDIPYGSSWMWVAHRSPDTRPTTIGQTSTA